MKCQWCESDKAYSSLEPAYWELPDGSRAIEITEVPSIKCPSCEMVYIDEHDIDELEDHFMIIDTKQLPQKITYKELMAQPKLLKRNYFKF